MAAIYHVSTPLAEKERSGRLYSGEILVFRGFDAVSQLVASLREQSRDFLGDDPEHLHEYMDPAGIKTAVEGFRSAVRKDERLTRELALAFQAVGVDPALNYGDALVPRVQTPLSGPGAQRTRPLSAHRDTWGSNIQAQVNWWAPLAATTPQRTITLFPSRFTRPVPNDSAGWDFGELVRRLKIDGPDTDYPQLPLAREAPPWEEALAISLLPGDFMCFSGAHLHASVPNTTERTRLSFETRTVNQDDLADG